MRRFKVVVQIKGGVGNQLFCYAAARAIALRNNSELVLDHLTGFTRDFMYNRHYELNHFAIRSRRATASERLEPLSRLRRRILLFISRQKAFDKRKYIIQEKREYDSRIVNLKLSNNIYLEGYWQSELYFKDINKIIRNDLTIVSPLDNYSKMLGEQMRNSNSVAVHIRWFDNPDKPAKHNISPEYYSHAYTMIENEFPNAHYYVFSDNPEAARSIMHLRLNRTTFIDHNHVDCAYVDLWLMTQCKHHITANSTFSWWAAWLGESAGQIVTTPVHHHRGITAWSFEGLIPERWREI